MKKNEKKNFSTPLHLACGKNEIRPAFEYVWFDKGYAYASDANFAIKQHVETYHTIMESENLNGHCIHYKAMAAIIKYDQAVATEEGIKCWNENSSSDAFFPYATIETKMPNFEVALTLPEVESVDIIGFNPYYMGLAGKLLKSEVGVSNIRCTFHGKTRGILLEEIGCPNQIVVIMPRLIDES